MKRRTLYPVEKRLFDIAAAALGLFFLTPFMIIVGLLIKLDSSGPILFWQQRIGLGGQLFWLVKFRTMRTAGSSSISITAANDPRVTKLGKKLRSLKIDELPQLFNVVRGDMSIVGPRPEVEEYYAYYPSELKSCLVHVRPGLTDDASLLLIDEENLLAADDDPHQMYLQTILPLKLKYVKRYIDNASMHYDLRLIARTVVKLLSRRVRSGKSDPRPRQARSLRQESHPGLEQSD